MNLEYMAPKVIAGAMHAKNTKKEIATVFWLKLLISAHLRRHGTREAGTHTLYVQHRGKRPRAAGTYRTR